MAREQAQRTPTGEVAPGSPAADALPAALARGESPPWDSLTDLTTPERAAAVTALLEDPRGRRWLRGFPGLDEELSGRLLAFEEDFRSPRRDGTLGVCVSRARLGDLLPHAAAIAAGPAATDFWWRLRGEVLRLSAVADQLVRGDDRIAAETTLALLVLDPLDPWELGEQVRAGIAESGLRSPFPTVRGLAAEFLSEANPGVLLGDLSDLVLDEDERLRAVAWAVAFRHARATARDLAFELLGDEQIELPLRRSALLAAGEHLPTDELVDLLAWFVAHRDPVLAGDAANLLRELHRNPFVAEAALRSPHAHVRATAAWLMDPLRGSPAAGGNRPGSPVDTAGIFEELARREADRRQSG